MCKQIYTVPFHQFDSQCQLEAYYDLNRNLFDGILLPIDDEGYCLFHSKKWEWKKQKKFEYRVKQLLEVLLQDSAIKAIDFRDFQFIPAQKETIIWSELTTTKTLNLSGSGFKGGLSFKNCQFSGEVYMDEINMEGKFSIEDCRFTSSFTAIQNAQFYGNVHIQDVFFNDLFDVNNSRFHGQIHLSEVIFNGYTVWNNVVNKSKDYAVSYFNFTNRDYTSFEGAVFHLPVQFENCTFQEGIHFVGTQFKKPLYITNPTVRGNVVFKGLSEEALIFENEVEIQIRTSNFEDSGQMIFENANLINLDRHTKNKLATFKANRQVVLGEGTIVFRISFKKQYAYSDLNEIFIHDLLTTIRQYFKRKLNRHFEFVFSQQGEDLIITFFTDDYVNLEDFKRDEKRVIKDLMPSIKAGVEDKVSSYLETKFHQQVFSFLETAIKKDIPMAILDNLLGRENVDIIINTGQISTIKAQRLEIGTVQHSQFYIARLEGMKNDPVFQLSKSQFDALKLQLSALNDETKWTELKTMLENIQKDLISKDTLLPFLADCGISVANNLSAGVLFIFLEYLLMRG